MAPAPNSSAPFAGANNRKAAAGRASSARKATRPRSDTRVSGEKVDVSTSRTPVTLVTGYAERAMLIQVGAALTARDRVVSRVNEVVTTYTTPAKAQSELQKFERRGSTARKDLEREVRRTRTRFERQLRRRRRNLERTVTTFEKRRDAAARNLSAQVETRLKESTGFVQERVLNRV
jgi:hypothetical protein